MRLLYLAVPLIVATCPAPAQAPAKPLSFEVASVKPAPVPIQTKDDYSAGYNAGMRSAMAAQGMRITGQRVNITDNSLKDLVRLAYQVKEYQIAAAPWMSSEKYEIVANMPAGANRSRAPEMLQTLLATRFHLQLHREKKKMPVYAVVAAKDGPKLTAATVAGRGGGAVMSPNGRGHLLARGATMAAFADFLTTVSDRPVIDGTGLSGIFDFDMTFGDVNSELPSLSVVLQEMGLKLEKRETEIEILVIDSADKLPVEN